MIAVEDTAPERPAARAKGTVSPSAIPMTMSRTWAEAEKCFSRCGVTGMGHLKVNPVTVVLHRMMRHSRTHRQHPADGIRHKMPLC